MVNQQGETLTYASVVGGRVFAGYLKDAASLVRVHDTAGKLEREVALPGVGTATGFSGRFDRKETFFSYTSLTTPASIYRLDVKTGNVTLFKKPTTAFDSDSFETRREFITSKDGTKVPIFHRAPQGFEARWQQPDPVVWLMAASMPPRRRPIV